MGKNAKAHKSLARSRIKVKAAARKIREMKRKPKSAKKPTRVIPEGLVTTPQGRILSALRLRGSDKPILPRYKIIDACGWSELSGTFSRAMNGVAKSSKVAEKFLGEKKGLLSLGYVVKVDTEVDGKIEHGFQITDGGVKALREFKKYWKFPKMKPKQATTNRRYLHTHEGKKKRRYAKRTDKRLKKVYVGPPDEIEVTVAA